MSSLNISLKKEAYDFLKSLKDEDKSFSDVILEFKGKSNKEKILELFKEKRDLSGIDWKAKEKRMREFRASFNKRAQETRKYMELSRKRT